MMNKFLASALVVAAFTFCGCATQVNRLAASDVVDLSGDWNDTDSQIVAKEMVQDVLSRPWLSKHTATKGKPPTVIVGNIKNLSHEHISTAAFIGDIERELINSGEIEFVASASERQGVREERKDQDLNATASTRNAMGQEIGAEFMLSGQINTIIDASSGDQVRYYQVDLQLISMADNRKVWAGQKKIKKLVENSKLRF